MSTPHTHSMSYSCHSRAEMAVDKAEAWGQCKAAGPLEDSREFEDLNWTLVRCREYNICSKDI